MCVFFLNFLNFGVFSLSEMLTLPEVMTSQFLIDKGLYVGHLKLFMLY